MNSKEISRLRLANQHIQSGKSKTVNELMRYMGALQAQDYPMSKWAAGLRLKKSRENIINAAINNGEILRTHLLRPTWHLVSSEDIYWMLELTASGIKKTMSSRNRQLELTPAVFRKSNNIIRSALEGNNHLTRNEIITILEKAGIRTDENRASHLLAEAELSRIICSGKNKGDKPTYALLDERVKKKNHPDRNESLQKLGEIYFTSRGPATVNDFSWWSGLTISESRKTIELISDKIISFKSGSQIYWMNGKSGRVLNYSPGPFLLPAYDEFLLSYKDRSAVLISDFHRSIISNNGIFRAIIVFDGKIIGIWKRTLSQEYLSFEFNYFRPPTQKLKSLINHQAEKYAGFSGKLIKIIIHN